MKKLLFRVVFCVFSLTALFVSQLFAAEYRTWTDVTGEHEVEAMLLDSDGKEVKLKRKDNGKIVTMSLNKLSLADRAEVKRTLGSSSDDSDDDNKHGKVSASSGMKPGLVKFSKIRELRTKNAGTTWSVEPDPAKVAKLDYVPDELAFQLKKQEYNVHKTGENFFFCDDIPDRVLGVTHLSQNSKRQTVVFVGDLKKSSVKSNILPVDLEPFGLTPNGKLALFRQKIDGERLSSSEQVLVISDVEDTKFRCLQVIEPFTKMGKESRTDIRWAAWADNNNIIAMAASNDNVVLFNMDDLTAVWSYPLLGTERPEFSPGRKYVVLPSKDGLFLVETLTGNVIGKFKFPTETNRFLSMTFSPDGKIFAALIGGVLYRWNATNGEAKEPFYIDTIGKLHWLDETYLMAGSILIDTKADYLLRRYTGTGNSDKVYAGLYWIMRNSSGSSTKNDDSELAAFTIPHVKLPPLQGITDSQRYCVVPGMKVKVQVEDGVPESDKVRESLTTTLKQNGLVISDDAAITLSAEITQLKPEKVTYSTLFSRSRGGSEIMFTPHKMNVSFTKDGEILWGRETKMSTPSVSVAELANSSLQDVVNEKSKPTSDWYLHVRIPKKVSAQKVGTSIISLNGIK